MNNNPYTFRLDNTIIDIIQINKEFEGRSWNAQAAFVVREGLAKQLANGFEPEVMQYGNKRQVNLRLGKELMKLLKSNKPREINMSVYIRSLLKMVLRTDL